MKLRMPGRFEWKILAALFIVACLPLGTAAYLMTLTLNRVSSITEQHQKEVRASLSSAVDVYRVYFSQMKEAFRERAEQIATGSWSHASDLASVPDLVRARVLLGERVVDEWSVPPATLEHTREGPPNLVELPGSKPEAPRLLELTFGISRELYDNFLALREAMNQEQELDRVSPVVLPMIFRALGIALVIVLALATAIGLFVARRATGRVATLREAARRVGEGDLAVRVHPKGRDELDELGRAFDQMVAELGDARSRLEYLQKVSAWQEVARRLAHEIKNPLTPIQLAVQELGSKYQGDDPAYHKLLATAQEILTEEIGAIRRLVDDFSAFAKLPKVEPAPVDLAQVVEDFVRTHVEWQPVLRIDREPAPVQALCDRMLIRRVLSNLVENAVQAGRRRAGTDLRPLRHDQGTRHRAGAGHREKDRDRSRRRCAGGGRAVAAGRGAFYRGDSGRGSSGYTRDPSVRTAPAGVWVMRSASACACDYAVRRGRFPRYADPASRSGPPDERGAARAGSRTRAPSCPPQPSPGRGSWPCPRRRAPECAPPMPVLPSRSAPSFGSG
jgi:two-component system, NtrC family, nitrogen regulation sensor histidine kinase NtrY